MEFTSPAQHKPEFIDIGGIGYAVVRPALDGLEEEPAILVLAEHHHGRVGRIGIYLIEESYCIIFLVWHDRGSKVQHDDIAPFAAIRQCVSGKLFGGAG